MKNLPQMPDIPEEEQTPLVKALLGILGAVRNAHCFVGGNRCGVER